MSENQTNKRLMAERRELLLNPIQGTNVKWTEIRKVEVEITAPEDSLYHDDIFTVEITFSNGYPQNPPRVVMKTPIFHPNIDSNGAVCVACLRNSYNQTVSVRQIVNEIIHALSHPNPDDELNISAANAMKTDYQRFEETVREIVNNNCSERNA